MVKFKISYNEDESHYNNIERGVQNSEVKNVKILMKMTAST